jgi:spore coat protein H
MSKLLPTVRIIVREGEWNRLQRDVWSADFVDASMVRGNRIEPIGMRFRGGHTREYEKKSFEIKHQEMTIHLNAEFDDPSMIRNALSFQFFDWIRVPSPKADHCVVYLNHQRLGVYLRIEGVDRAFFERRGIQMRSLFYAGNDDANFGLLSPESGKLKKSLFQGYELIVGDERSRTRLEKFILSLNTLSGRQLFQFLQNHLDIDEYFRWLAGAVCTGNYDGFNQNYALYESGSTNNCCYRIVPWDYEGTWGRNCFGEVCHPETVRLTGYNTLSRKLLSYKRLRQRYREILDDVLTNAFTTERCERAVKQLIARVRPDFTLDRLRKYSIEEFDQEPEFISTYVRKRRRYILQEMKRLC